MPDKLLTTRELVDLLQLDRVTIYKMVKDGELPSLRVGGQWRFSEEAIGAWLRGRRGETIPEPTAVAPELDAAQLKLTDLVPLPTLQAIQNQFSELLGVSSFITDLDGQPLAPCSRCARFCRLVHTRPEGMQACQASWRAIGRSDRSRRGRSHLPCRHPVRERADHRRRPTPGHGDGRTISDGAP